MSSVDAWPDLPFAAWNDTATTLHLWTQIVGKVRLAQTPWMNHSWHVTLYLTARGLTTRPIPHGDASFQIDFDFIDHRAAYRGERRRAAPASRSRPSRSRNSIATLMAALRQLGIQVRINDEPNEIAGPMPFSEDAACLL